MRKLIAVTIGDIEGIGIRLLYKEWKNNRNNLVSIYENFVKRDSFVETIIKKD